jgi:hypothetical protein
MTARIGLYPPVFAVTPFGMNFCFISWEMAPVLQPAVTRAKLNEKRYNNIFTLQNNGQKARGCMAEL